MDDRPKTNALWWAVPAAVVLLLALLGMFGRGVEPPQAPPPHSTYDASRDGVRAAYLLLEGLDYDVTPSRRLSAGRVRWLLFPASGGSDSADDDGPLRRKGKSRSAKDEAEPLANWVRDGSTLLLADDKPAFAELLGLRMSIVSDAKPSRVQVDPRPLELSAGSVRVTPLDRPDRVWPERGEPLASIFRRNRGEIWIIHRPGIFRNEAIRDADNALAICRLADVTSHDRAERICFDEFFHGLRERPGPMQLLLQPPALWVTLQGLAVLALLLWRFLPRFGPLRDAPPARRRSKEEFLDAMAYLLTRKGAYAEAFRQVRDALARDLEQALGLPATTTAEELAAHAALRRPGLDEEKLVDLLTRKNPPAGADGFLQALHDLDTLRREFFHE